MALSSTGGSPGVDLTGLSPEQINEIGARELAGSRERLNIANLLADINKNKDLTEFKDFQMEQRGEEFERRMLNKDREMALKEESLENRRQYQDAMNEFRMAKLSGDEVRTQKTQLEIQNLELKMQAYAAIAAGKGEPQHWAILGKSPETNTNLKIKEEELASKRAKNKTIQDILDGKDVDPNAMRAVGIHVPADPNKLPMQKFVAKNEIEAMYAEDEDAFKIYNNNFLKNADEETPYFMTYDKSGLFNSGPVRVPLPKGLTLGKLRKDAEAHGNSLEEALDYLYIKMTKEK